MNNPLSYLDSFNAKHLSPADVARDFVAPAQFFQLLGLNHCVLIGPRGSGKTTLLKMLQVDSDHEYSINRRSSNNPSIEFIGIFVPADVRWAKQLAAHVDCIEAVSTKERLYELAFGTSVLLAMLDTIDKCREFAAKNSENVGQFSFSIDRTGEVALAQRLADLWATPIEIPSLSELKHRLRLRQTKFPMLAGQLKNGATLDELGAVDPYLSLGWLDAVVTAMETINESIHNSTQRWALLLDELEIVPPSLLKSIVTCLRSTSSNLSFKLALSPSASGVFSSIQESEPTQGNDFKILNLWYTERDDLRKFAGRLLSQALKRRGMEIDADILPSILGRSNVFDNDIGGPDFSESGAKTGTDDAVGHKDKRQLMFSELASKDESFLAFVERSEIDLENLDLSDRKKQGPLIRKVAPLVQFRNRAIKEWSAERPILRSGRPAYDPFFGFPNILDITEGNPRWVLNLADLLDGESRKKGLPISAPSVQSAAITALHQRFAAMLKIYPVKPGKNGEVLTLYGFLEILANFVRKRLYFDEFSADPPQSFEIDAQGEQDYGVLLETAIHLGALVIMNPESSKRVLDSPDSIGLIGSRVRLCYRLAPEFFVPLRSTGQAKLSAAMNLNTLPTTTNLAAKTSLKTTPEPSPQSRLF